jgi:Thrombospondin type 1 domain.
VEWSHWGKCSATCGGGTQTRHSRCVDMDVKKLELCLQSGDERVESRTCNAQPCPTPSHHLRRKNMILSLLGSHRVEDGKLHLWHSTCNNLPSFFFFLRFLLLPSFTSFILRLLLVKFRPGTLSLSCRRHLAEKYKLFSLAEPRRKNLLFKQGRNEIHNFKTQVLRELWMGRHVPT